MTGDLSTRQQVLATSGIMLALLLISLDQTIVGTAMPRIVAELNGLNVYAWVTTGYLVASTVLVPIAGKLGDMFGRKPFLLVGMIGFMVGSWLCGFSQNMTELILFRGVQGLFGGMLFANIFAVLADIFTIEQRARMQGVFGAVFGLSSVVGPTAGGYITDHWGWRWIFYVNVPVGVLAVIVVLAALPYVRSTAVWRDIDFAGAAILAAGIVPLLLGLSITSDHAWTSPQVLCLLIAAAVMLPLFFLIETRSARNPVVAFDLFRSNQFTIPVLVAFFSGIGMFGAILFVPLLYQGVLGISATSSGNLLIPMMVGLVVFSTITGQIMVRIPRYRFLATLGLAGMVGGMWLLARITPESSQWSATAAIFLVGAGLGTTFPLTMSVVQAAMPRQLIGVASSQIQFWRNLGGTVGSAVLGSVLSNRLSGTIQDRVAALHLPSEFRLPGSGSSPQAALDPAHLAAVRSTLPPQSQPLFDQVVVAMRLGLADSLHDVFLIAAGIVLIALVASVFLKEIPLRRTHAEEEEEETRLPAVRLLLAATSYVILRRRGLVPQPVAALFAAAIHEYASAIVAGDAARIPHQLRRSDP